MHQTRPISNRTYLCSALVAATAFCSVAAQVDYDGHEFATERAPKLSFEERDRPSPEGIDYAFKEQTAHGVALLSRFPEFKLSDRRIHVDGPWYESEEANLHFSRGISSVGAIPRYREKEAGNVRKLRPERKWMLMTDPLWWGYATKLAADLEKKGPKDPRIASLLAFGRDHYFTNDAAAYKELGRQVYLAERWPTDVDGRFVGYASIDIEGTGGWEHQRNCFGWLYQGMLEGAAEVGSSFTPMLYGQWQFSVGCFWESMRQGGSGHPEYLMPEKDFLAGPDPTLEACQRSGGIISVDGYQQAMWGMEPFMKREANGSLLMKEGKPVFNDTTTTRAYGWELSLEPGEAKRCLEDLYRAALRMYLQHHRMAGEYPSRSGLRKSFLSNCRIGAWSRYTNEGVLGIQQNDRPLPGWLLDLLIGMYLFTADDVTLWSSDMNFNPGPLGGNYTNAWRYNSHGVLESVVKAAHRYSALDELHASGGEFQWCWFNLPVVNKNETAGEGYHEKPIAMGKLRRFKGGTYLELFVAWPALDGDSREMKVWIEREGRRSKAYTIRLAHGRTYFYDAWRLPDDLGGVEGRDVWLRGKDLTGKERTWRGDWRESVDGALSVPEPF